MKVLSLVDLKDVGHVGSGDVHFARLCAALDEKELRPDVEVLAAVVSAALAQGHPCVPLNKLGEQLIPDEDGRVVGMLPSTDRLRSAVQRSSSQSAPSATSFNTPLIVDERERVYVARYFEHEERLARALAHLVERATVAEGPPEQWLTNRLDHYFPPQDGEEDLQRRAAEVALNSPLSVISGGPGTGKTSTVVKILALLFEDAERRGEPAPVVRLLAPTGKAAARMMEATGSAFQRLSVPSALVERVQEASTIHRALGVIPGNATRFVRGPEHPLRADVVLVDEASMVDLALMRHLIEALNPGARLILLGDRHQLASVEAGSVLSELCTELSQGDAAGRFTVELTKSYRFSGDSGIAAFAHQVRAGNAPGSLGVLNSGRADLKSEPCPADPVDSAALRALAVERYGAALRLDRPAEVLQELSRFRILCAHRRGRFGIEHLNDVVTGWLVESGLVPQAGGPSSVGAAAGAAQFFRGRLILITENDYGLGLYNGDIGLVWPDENGRLSVFFETESGDLRSLSPAKLPAHETAYALTIHKSQGSEHEQIAVVLPQAESPLLTRELLYTGVTRAKQSVTVFGNQDSIVAAVNRTVTRHSGLGEKLAQART